MSRRRMAPKGNACGHELNDCLIRTDDKVHLRVLSRALFTNWIRRSRAMARAALVKVWSVTEALPGASRRSSAARLVCIRLAISTLVIFSFSIAC